MLRLLCSAGGLPWSRDETSLQIAPVTFDAATPEIWGPLLHGGRVVLVPGRRVALARLGALLAEQRVTTLLLTAGLFHEVADACPQALRPLRRLFAGGDVVSPDHARKALACHPRLTLLDSYGPTECTTFTTARAFRSSREVTAAVSIGRPIANTRVLVLDSRQHPVAPGTPGELYAGGDGLARGYHLRPGLTATRFVPNPVNDEPGERLYRSGDLVRHLADGNLDFLGRVDRQVKLRGFRVEPGEVEAALRAHPEVRQAVVVLRRDLPAGPALVAYVVPQSGGDVENTELQAFLARQLPEHLRPQVVVVLPALPLTVQGKVDRASLPVPEAAAPAPFEPPRSAAEKALAEIFAELLGHQPIGARDRFFALGGHSLLALRLLARLRQRCGRELPLSALFEDDSVAGLAARLRTRPIATSPLVALGHHGNGYRPRQRPLFLVHPAGGHVLCYQPLARQLGATLPLWGFQSDGSATSVEQLAEVYLQALRHAQPAGPYRLGGWSMGGLVAFEMARRLPDEVELLVLIDPPEPLRTPAPDLDTATQLALFGRDLAGLRSWTAAPAALPALSLGRHETPETALPRLLDEAQKRGLVDPQLTTSEALDLLRRFQANHQAAGRYLPGHAGAPTLLLRSAEHGSTTAWRHHLSAELEVVNLPGDHYAVTTEAGARFVAEVLRSRVGERDEAS